MLIVHPTQGVLSAPVLLRVLDDLLIAFFTLRLHRSTCTAHRTSQVHSSTARVIKRIGPGSKAEHSGFMTNASLQREVLSILKPLILFTHLYCVCGKFTLV